MLMISSRWDEIGAILKGLQSLSPGLRGTSYPGVHNIKTINPERVEPKMTLVQSIPTVSFRFNQQAAFSEHGGDFIRTGAEFPRIGGHVLGPGGIPGISRSVGQAGDIKGLDALINAPDQFSLA